MVACQKAAREGEKKIVMFPINAFRKVYADQPAREGNTIMPHSPVPHPRSSTSRRGPSKP